MTAGTGVYQSIEAANKGGIVLFHSYAYPLGSRRWAFTRTRIISTRACASEGAAYAYANIPTSSTSGRSAFWLPSSVRPPPASLASAVWQRAHCCADDILIRAFGDTLVVLPLTLVFRLVQGPFETIGDSVAATA